MTRVNANEIFSFSPFNEIHVLNKQIFLIVDVKSEIPVHHLVNHLNICRPHIFLQKLKLLPLIGSSEHQAEQNEASEQISGEVSAGQYDHPSSKNDYPASGLDKF